jgi:hypothetical protein
LKRSENEDCHGEVASANEAGLIAREFAPNYARAGQLKK